MPKTRRPKGTGSYRTLPNGSKQWRQRIDGQERTITARTSKELEEKKKLIADLPIIKINYKVSDWFEKWLEIYVKPLKKPATYNQYKDIYEQHIKPVIGKRKLSSINKTDIQLVIAEMAKKTRLKRVKDAQKYVLVDTGQKLSTWTMKHTKKVLNIAFKKAVEDKIIPSNPVEKIDIPRRQAKPRKTLTTEELKLMFDYLKNTRWYWAFKFMLVTGLRRGELLALRWSDINYETKKITIDESNSIDGLGDTKSAKVHYVPLSDKAKEYLMHQKKSLELEGNPALFNEELKKLDLVFPSKTGGFMSPEGFNSVLDRMNKKVGIHVTPHMLRHTFVYMSKGLMSLSELQEALGHDESTTTLDIYGTMLSDTEKVAEKIDKAFATLDDDLNKVEIKEQAKVIDIFSKKKRPV